jgi:hypothetical protein
MNLFNIKKKNKDTSFNISPILPKEIYQLAVLDLKDIIAPSALDINSKYIDLGEKLSRTFFIISYPRFLSDG